MHNKNSDKVCKCNVLFSVSDLLYVCTNNIWLMFTCMIEKADFKHEQEDHKSYDNDILQMINFWFEQWWSLLLLNILSKFQTD